ASALGPWAAAVGARALGAGRLGRLRHRGPGAAAGGVRIELDPREFTVAEPVLAAAKELGADPLEWVLTGGEDHALAAVFPADVRLPPEFQVVGRVVEGEGVMVYGREIGRRGWDHFR
ncbi:thiamine-phosphate kinase, partial [Nonomuraea sp. NPDC048892]